MIWGKSNITNEQLKHLLKKSGSDFQFDPAKVKYRLLTSIDATEQAPRSHFHFTRVAKYSVGFAGTVVFLSVTFAFASNSRPGDKLFALTKLGEQVILNLPLSIEQKAKVEAYIVTNRLAALDFVQTKSAKAATVSVKANTTTASAVEATNLATVKETDESFSSAVEKISLNKQDFEAKGNTQAADRLEKLLDQLQEQAEAREATIKSLEEQTQNADIKIQMQTHLTQLKSARLKARAQIRRFKLTPIQIQTTNQSEKVLETTNK